MEEKLEFSTLEEADFGQRIVIPIENCEEQDLPSATMGRIHPKIPLLCPQKNSANFPQALSADRKSSNDLFQGWVRAYFEPI